MYADWNRPTSLKLTAVASAVLALCCLLNPGFAADTPDAPLPGTARSLREITGIAHLLSAPDSGSLGKMVSDILAKPVTATGGFQPLFGFEADVNKVYSEFMKKPDSKVCDGPGNQAVFSHPPDCMETLHHPPPAQVGLDRFLIPYSFSVWLNSLHKNPTIWAHVNDPTKSAIVSDYYKAKSLVLGYQPIPAKKTDMVAGSSKPTCIYTTVFCISEKTFLPTPTALEAGLKRAFDSTSKFFEPPNYHAPAWVANTVFQKVTKNFTIPDACTMNMAGTTDSRGGLSRLEFTYPIGCTAKPVPGVTCRRIPVSCLY